MEEFNLEQFTKDYIEALKAEDGEKLVALIHSIKTEEDRVAALDGVIKAIEGDEALKAESPKLLEVLEAIKTKSENEKEKEKEAVVEAPALEVTPTEA